MLANITLIFNSQESSEYIGFLERAGGNCSYNSDRAEKRLRWIMQEPQRSHGIAAEAGKIVFRQIERQRDAAHHPFTQREHHVHISLHHRPEVRPLRRPLIGAVI